MTPTKMRILCLHGYHGSSAILPSQMNALTSQLDRTTVDFVFIDAPTLSDGKGDFGWWHSITASGGSSVVQPGDPGVPGAMGTVNGTVYSGWNRTAAFIVDVFRKQGPFDGVFGFSQGAALTGLLTGLRAPDGIPTRDRPLVFNFAIMVGGFPAKDPALAQLYHNHSSSYALPSVHIIGTSDGIVPSNRSYALADRFVNPVVLTHPGGHIVASTPTVVKGVREFLNAQWEAKKSRQVAPAAAPAPTSEPRKPISVPLWPNRASPTMRVYFPRTPPTTRPSPAIVVLRGGAYGTSSGSGGGTGEWAASKGFVGVEVFYRTRGDGEVHPAAFLDATRAMRLVRSKAEAWKLDANRVALLGYSAGGHLASLVATQPALFRDPSDDLLTSIYPLPSLIILGYPLISFVEGYSPGAFVSSVENFLGRPSSSISLQERQQYSSELHVSKDLTPPTFIWTTRDDRLVPARHSEVFAEACRKVGVEVELRVFESGPHGLGLALGRQGELGRWTDDLVRWMEQKWGPV